MWDIISSSVNKLYDKWIIHISVPLSLLLQTILILFAPFRKRTRSTCVIFQLWIAYLLADWAAIFAIGLISNSQKEVTQKAFRHPNERDDILAFWAPFLLLHLGGPDTITAFAIEDNAFWLRHLVGLITQVSTTISLINQSLPRNKLWLPTVMMSRDNTRAARTTEHFLPLLSKLLSLKGINWTPTSEKCKRWDAQWLFGRWSGSLHTHNFLSYCPEEIPRTNYARRALVAVTKYFGLKDLYDRMVYKGSTPLTESLWTFLFDELKQKSYLADDLETAIKMRLARGHFAVEDNVSDIEVRDHLMHYIVDIDYDQSLIVWHIATNICYEMTKIETDIRPKMTKIEDEEEKTYLEFCKNLSEYMFYLLTMQPTMMSAVAGMVK